MILKHGEFQNHALEFRSLASVPTEYPFIPSAFRSALSSNWNSDALADKVEA
jgi:hypothetical protein